MPSTRRVLFASREAIRTVHSLSYEPNNRQIRSVTIEADIVNLKASYPVSTFLLSSKKAAKLIDINNKLLCYFIERFGKNHIMHY